MGWLGLAAGGGRGNPVPLILLLAALAVTAVAARMITRIHGWLVPLLVWAAVTLHAVSAGAGPAVRNPLEYANASGALFFLATAAALMVFARCPRPLARIVCLWAAVATGVIPWISGAQASAALVCALPLAFAPWLRRRGDRFLLAGGALLVCLALGATVLLGLTYQGRERTDLAGRVVDATLTERRLQLWHDALSITRSSPALGIGLRRFDEVSPTALAHQDQPQAHSEYLQMAAETGLVGFALFLGLLLWGFARLRSDTPDTAAAVAAIALAGIGIHASIDYILQFPAVPIAAAALVGAGSVTRPVGTGAPGAGDERRRRTRAMAGAYSVSLVLVLLAPLTPFHPSHMVANGAVPGIGGVRFASAGMVGTAQQANDLRDAVTRAGRFTVEMWAEPAPTQQSDAGWLVSNSRGPSVRNFTVGQSGHDLILRLRTTQTNVNGSRQVVTVPGVFQDGEQHHVAITYNGEHRRVFVDGRLRLEVSGPGGSMAGWDSSYPLLLGNEIGGGRPWLGSLYQVTLYDRALPGTELRRHHEAGPPRPEAAEPLVRYRIEGRTVAPDLSVPAKLPAPQPDFATALFRFEGGSLRMVPLILLFLPFGFTTRALLGPRSRYRARRAVFLVLAMGLMLAFGVEFFQHLQSRTSSIVHVAGAGLGTGLGAAAWSCVQRRSRAGKG